MRLIAALFVAIVILVIVIAVAFSSLERTPEYLTPEQVQMRVAAERNAHLRWQVVGWVGTVSASLAMLGGAYFVVALAKNKRERIYADPDTGLWPITKEDRAPFWKRLMGEHDWIIEDPNLAIAPTRRIHANGKLTVEADTHGASLEEQAKYAGQSWGVQRTVAAASAFAGARPNTAMMKAAAGVYDEEARRKRAQAEREEQRLVTATPTVIDVEPPQLEAKTHRTLADALAGHRDLTIPLGQSSEHGLLLWNPQHDAHLGVWGKTGTGKTTRAGMTIATAQLKIGYQVIVIDPEQNEGNGPGGLWGTLAPWAQVVSPGVPGCSLWEQIMDAYEKRWRQVTSAGATDAYHMPSGKPLRPLAIHFDEYARWRAKYKALGGEWGKYVAFVDDCIAELAQRGRKRGYHLTVYGQLPGDLPEQIAGNLVGMTFKQNANQGNKVGYWAAHELREGQFAYEGRVYESFAPLLEIPEILRNKAPVAGLLTADATIPGERSPRSFSEHSVDGSMSETQTHTPTVNVQPVNGVNATDAQRIVWEWRDAHRGGTQAELRAHLQERGIQISRGHVHNCWHDWPGDKQQPATPPQPPSVADQLAALGVNLAEVRLPGGERLGVDITHGRA